MIRLKRETGNVIEATCHIRIINRIITLVNEELVTVTKKMKTLYELVKYLA